MIITGEIKDDQLLRQIADGSEAAFTAFFRRWQGPVYRFALRMCGSPDAAEEAAQEVFMAVMRQAGRFDPSLGSVSSWLLGMARNHVLRGFEKSSRYDALDDIAIEPAADGSTALEDLTRGERVETLRVAVLALPARYREVVVLCDLEELGYDEAARVVGCPVGTVRSRLSRGRAMLVEKLKSLAGCAV